MPTEATYTFDVGFPTLTDATRSQLRDTGQGQTYPEGDWILSDQEITTFLANNGWNDGLASCAEAMAAEFSRRSTIYKAGSTDAEFQWRDRVTYYQDLAQLARKGAIAQPTTGCRPIDSPVAVPSKGKRQAERALLGRGRWDML